KQQEKSYKYEKLEKYKHATLQAFRICGINTTVITNTTTVAAATATDAITNATAGTLQVASQDNNNFTTSTDTLLCNSKQVFSDIAPATSITRMFVFIVLCEVKLDQILITLNFTVTIKFVTLEIDLLRQFKGLLNLQYECYKFYNLIIKVGINRMTYQKGFN
ncbi:2640_t:CDS:2, partial [Gigaspora margarita]